MQRLGSLGKLKSESVQKYIDLHAHTWPSVLQRNAECHIQNYSIFHKQLPGGEHWVFSYFEYTGTDFEADMQRLAADPEIQRWWAECKPCFQRHEDLPAGEVWAPMEQVFFQP